MKNDKSWEQKELVNELIQGMEVAKKLKADLRLPASADTRDLLVQRILSSYDKALQLVWNASISKSQTMLQTTKTSSPESPVSVKTSPKRENVDGVLKDYHKGKRDSKKRKLMPKWMNQVRVNSKNGLEAPNEDGYNWRKYGQKDILGAKYPRSYYRCTFRNTKGCLATKQVQRSDEDPAIFDMTYRGSHTCSSQGNNAVLPPKSPDIQEKPHSLNSDIHHAQPPQERLTEFRNILTVNGDNMGNEETYPFTSPSTSFGCMTLENHGLLPSVLENDSFFTSLSQSLVLSPNTPESNYFPSPSFRINEFDGVYKKPCLGSDTTEIISANTSATNSPIIDFNFSLDPVEIESNFPFNTSGFFS